MAIAFEFPLAQGKEYTYGRHLDRKNDVPQGLKPGSLPDYSAKAKALAYLEAPGR